nr:S41 family peptidase [Aurantibacter crassamenti]
MLLLKKGDSVYFQKFKWIKKGRIIQRDSATIGESKTPTKAEKLAYKAKQKSKKKAGRSRGYVPSRDYYLRNFEFIGENNSVAYLKIRAFGDGNQRKFYRETFAKIDSAKSANLIIDIRDNGGGSIDEIENLYAYLALKPFNFVNDAEALTKTPATKATTSLEYSGFIDATIRLFSIPGLLIYDLFHVKKKGEKRYYKLSNSKLKKPKENNFNGKIYVLINGYSFSASSILSTNLQATNRAIFVGEETGGGYNGTVAGQSKYVTLPNSKVRMKFGLLHIESPFHTDPIGYGIKPDVQIIPTQKDRLQKRDPELEWVLNNIREGN